MIEDGAFSHKIDYVPEILNPEGASKLHYWFTRYGAFAEWVDFPYWGSFSGEGSVSAACAAGLF